MEKTTKDGRVIVPWEDLDLSRASSTGDSAILCPNCSHTRRKKGVKCFSVNVSKGVGSCKHCSAISFDPSKSINNNNYNNVRPKEYILPKSEDHFAPSQNIYEWFRDYRGITKETVDAFQIRTTNKYFPQIGGKAESIVFPYYRNRVLTNNKYRDVEKHFTLESKAELILYNLDAISKCETAIITEGEIDAMACHQAGFTNVVSVPNGVSGITDQERKLFEETGQVDTSRAIKLDYIDNSYNQIKHIKNWIIFTDTDLPGLKLRNELIRRFGATNCKIIDVSHLDCKDANDVLLNHGEDVLNKCISEAKLVPLEDIKTADDCHGELLDLLENGKPLGFDTTMDKFNDHFRQSLNSVDLIVGSANAGKSTYIMWYYVWTSVLYGWRHAIFTPESESTADVFRLAIQILTGKTFKKGFTNTITKAEFDLARRWVNEHFYIVEFKDEGRLITYKEVVDKFNEMIKRYGINTCTIDPFNSLYYDNKGKSIDLYYQEALTYIRSFTRRNNLKFIIAVHPNSESDRAVENHDTQGVRPKVIELADVSGGSIWKNRIDNGMSLYRNMFNKDFRTITELHIKKIKHQETIGTPTPKTEPITFSFKPELQRFVTTEGEDPLESFFEQNIYLPSIAPEQEVFYEKPKPKPSPSKGFTPPDFDVEEIKNKTTKTDSNLLF